MLCTLAVPAGSAQAAEAPGVPAHSAVLISGDDGTVLFEKDARQQLAMASTTKIMTALLTLEEAERSGDLALTVTEEMVRVEGSSMGLRAGPAGRGSSPGGWRSGRASRGSGEALIIPSARPTRRFFSLGFAFFFRWGTFCKLFFF